MAVIQYGQASTLIGIRDRDKEHTPISATFSNTACEDVVTESQPKSCENYPIYEEDEMKPKISDIAQAISINGEDVSIITILEEIQEQYRYLPHEAMILVSDW